MGDERGDSSTSLLVYWIIYKSDQLEEVGVYWTRDSKKSPPQEEKGCVTWQLSYDRRLNRSSDRAEGEALWPCFCHRFENIRMRLILIGTSA